VDIGWVDLDHPVVWLFCGGFGSNQRTWLCVKGQVSRLLLYDYEGLVVCPVRLVNQ
jgi:hypothetical protein